MCGVRCRGALGARVCVVFVFVGAGACVCKGAVVLLVVGVGFVVFVLVFVLFPPILRGTANLGAWRAAAVALMGVVDCEFAGGCVVFVVAFVEVLLVDCF